MDTFTKSVSEPWFSLILLGLKTVEGRLNKGDFNQMKKGDTIIFHNSSLGFDRRFSVVVKNIKKYSSFEKYLTSEGLQNTLPGIINITDGVKVYHKYYSVQDEKKYGILAIGWT